MGQIFRLSLRQLVSRTRLLLIVLLAALPVGMAALIAALVGEDEASNTEFTNTLLDGLLIAGALPIVTMVLATATLGNEIEDRTLSYLTLKPLHRTLIVLPKLLAAVVVGGPLLIVSGVVTTYIGISDLGAVLIVAESDIQVVLAVGVTMLAGVVTYAAIFTWAGLMSTRALAFALVYVFLWEGLISSLLPGVQYLSVRGYTLSIMHGLDDTTFAALGERVIEFPAAIAGVVITTVVFFFFTVRRLYRMDVP